MIGSLVNAAVSVLLLVVTSHIVGGKAAGIFSLAYSTAQMMYTVSMFEMRNIQVTDAKGEFPFSYVEMFRIITTAAMWVFFAVFCAVRGYDGEKLVVMIALTLYMSLLSFSDLFQGNMHLNGYLSIAGKSLAGQVVLAATVFSVALFLTKKLWISVILMTISVALWIIIYDIPFNNNFDGLKPRFNFTVQKNMFLCALPLFLSSFLHMFQFLLYLNNIFQYHPHLLNKDLLLFLLFLVVPLNRCLLFCDILLYFLSSFLFFLYHLQIFCL